MFTFVMVIHGLVCVMLAVVILMQAGRGGGLTENFAAAESMFGAKTNEFMVKITAILTAVFFVTSMSLAYLSSRKGQSLIPANVGVQRTQTKTVTLPPVTKDDVSKAAEKAAAAPVSAPEAATAESDAE